MIFYSELLVYLQYSALPVPSLSALCIYNEVFVYLQYLSIYSICLFTVFSITFPCTGNISADVEVVIQMNISIFSASNISVLNFKRKKTCLMGKCIWYDYNHYQQNGLSLPLLDSRSNGFCLLHFKPLCKHILEWRTFFFYIKVPVNQCKSKWHCFHPGCLWLLETVSFNAACSWFVLQIYGIRKRWGTSCTTTNYNRSRLGPSTSPTTLSPWTVRVPL